MQVLKALGTGLLIASSVVRIAAAEGVTWPNFSEGMEAFCSSHPYDCEDNGIVTPHLVNTFFYDFYLEVEDFFSELGFDNAEFEYCKTEIRCLEEGVSVKNSKYKITQRFPEKRSFFYAFGGVNSNLGVHFSKALSKHQADQWCSTEVRPGENLSRGARNAIAKSDKSLWEIREEFYEKYSLTYVRYFPQINFLDQQSRKMDAMCWLSYKRKRIVFEARNFYP